MRKMEKILKALANRRRLAILKYLKENKKVAVTEIAQEIDLSFKATSKHLSILLAVDILERDQVGSQMFYCLVAQQKSEVKHILSLL